LAAAAAALGGLFLTSFHLRRKTQPKLGLVAHALAAVLGFALLAAVAFGVV
jgi:hypothetical protein